MSKIKVGEKVGILRGNGTYSGHKWTGRTGTVVDTVESDPTLTEGGYYVNVQIDKIVKREQLGRQVVAFFVDEIYRRV